MGHPRVINYDQAPELSGKATAKYAIIWRPGFPRLIKNKNAVRSLEKAILRKEKPVFAKNIRLFEALYREAVLLGAFPPQDKLSGIDVDIKIARAINRVSKTP